jgi:hypothetical protein
MLNGCSRLRLVFLFSFFSGSLSGQDFLEGAWKGKYTLSIYSDYGYPFEIFLRIEGRTISGRSYLVTPDKKKLEMDVKGYLFQDLSFILEETAIIKSPENSENTFFRKYQLRFKGDLWTKNLEGFWQEVLENSFDKSRKGGKILLTKEKDQKA